MTMSLAFRSAVVLKLLTACTIICLPAGAPLFHVNWKHWQQLPVVMVAKPYESVSDTGVGLYRSQRYPVPEEQPLVTSRGLLRGLLLISQTLGTPLEMETWC